MWLWLSENSIILDPSSEMPSHMDDKTNSRLDAKKTSDVNYFKLESDQMVRALVLMDQITSSSRGPYGKIKMVQNSVGGHLTMTSTSTRLLSAMSFSNPIVKLVINSAQGHLKKFNDTGHLLMSICLNLILESLKLDISRKILIDLFEIFLSMCLKYLGDKNTCNDNIQREVVFSDLKQMSSIVKSILKSKPFCKFSSKNLKMCSDLLLETFLSSLPNDNSIQNVSDGVSIVACEGENVDKSTILHGLLLQCPEIVSHSKQSLQLRTLKTEQNNYILVALVTVSMSGDTEEIGSMQFESDVHVDTEHYLLDVLEEFCDKLMAVNVGLLLCQRVVHPRLKQWLRQHSIEVVDRLGVSMTAYIQDVSGAVPIRFFQNLDVQMMGKVASVEHKILQDKSYLLLSPLADKCVVTLILYSLEEEQLSELRTVCSACLLSLRHLVQSPRALLGAGCWQTHLAAVLKNKVMSNRADIIRKTGCTTLSLTKACKVFTNTLEKVAMGTGHDGQDHLSDNEYGHLWHLPKGSNPDQDTVVKCACGALQQNISKLNDLVGSSGIDAETSIKQDPNGHLKLSSKLEDLDPVLDLTAPCVAALTSGVLTANTVLSIGQFIQDNN